MCSKDSGVEPGAIKAETISRRAALKPQTRGVIAMPLIFPNASRSFDTTRDAVRFWGYDSAMECSFFVTWAALARLTPGLRHNEIAVLDAFDMNRELILRTASKVYSRGRKGSYEVKADDL